MVLEGERKVVPIGAYPIFTIEPGTVAGSWATTRAQRPRYSFSCVLKVKVDNEKFGVEYITTLGATIAEIMTNPENLQLPIVGESKWDLVGGLCQTYMLNSTVEDANYGSLKEGTLRRAEFNWTVLVHEPYPESKWQLNSYSSPTVIRPQVVPV